MRIEHYQNSKLISVEEVPDPEVTPRDDLIALAESKGSLGAMNGARDDAIRVLAAAVLDLLGGK